MRGVRRVAVLAAGALVVGSGAAGAVVPAAGGGGGGTSGDDVLRGGRGPDVIAGLDGDDRIYGRRGSDRLHGDRGADRLYGGRGADRLRGGGGPDVIFGELGADHATGGAGNDRVYAGRGRDHVEGGDGDDVLFARAGKDVEGRGDRDGDRVQGGAGDDVAVTRDGERDHVSCGDGRDSVRADFKDRVDASCETVERRAALDPPRSPNRRAADAVAWAVRQAGTCEQPPGSNAGPKIDAWQRNVGMHGQPWCGIFIHQAYLEAGLDLDDGMASTDWIREAAEQDGGRLVQIPLSRARRGDLVLFDFVPGDGDPDSHVALVRSRVRDGRIATVEGNTSHCVRRLQRAAGDVVMAVRIR